MKIAAILDPNGLAGSIYQKSTIKVFEKQGDEWEIAGEYENPILQAKDVGQLRLISERFSEALVKLGCQAIVGKISGVVFRSMEKVGMTSFEITDSPEKHLDEIGEQLLEIFEQRHRNAERLKVTGLFKESQEPNSYKINMIKALEQHPELTTKKILMPFFEKMAFEKVYVMCDHIPHWLEKTVSILGYTFVAKSDGESYVICIQNPKGMQEQKNEFDCGSCTGCGSAGEE